MADKYLNWTGLQHFWNGVKELFVIKHPESTASGSIVSVSDALDGNPISLKVDIEPVQSGSGDPSPTNVRPISGWTGVNVQRTGKNLFNEESVQDIRANNDGYISGYYYKVIHLAPQTTYTVSHRAGTANSNVIALIHNVPKVNESGFFDLRTASGSKTFTTDSAGNLYIGLYNSGTTNAQYNARIAECKIQIEVGTTATEYEPYNGETYSVSFGEAGTVYGGTLDVITGLLTVTMGSVDLGTLNWKASASSEHSFYATAPRYKAGNTVVMLCAKYTYVGAVTTNYYEEGKLKCYVGSPLEGTAREIYIKDSAYTDVATFKAAMSGVMLVYELATPQTYQLTPTEVDLLLNSNTIWADTGDSELTYLVNNGKNLFSKTEIVGLNDAPKSTWYAATTGTVYTSITLTTETGDFVLQTGAKLIVKYAYRSTAASNTATTFNVDGTGAVSVKNKHGDNGYAALAGEVAEFVYDGTNFVALTEEAYITESRLTTSIAKMVTSVSVIFRPRIANPHITVTAQKLDDDSGVYYNNFTAFSYYFSTNPANMVSTSNYTLTIVLNAAQSDYPVLFNIGGDIGKVASK